MTRKPLTKKIRFEVFKRDRFTCQYCGRIAPDVILEVDHISPVAEGGDDDLLNLITSCRDCNRGKGKTPLNRSDVLKKQQDQIQQLAERKEQIEMLAEWRKELSQIEETEVDIIEATIQQWSSDDLVLYEKGRNDVRKLLKRFSLDEVIEGVEISFSKYYYGTIDSWNRAFNKIGGVCYNRKYRRNDQ